MTTTCSIHTEDELRVLHDLTGWALDGGHALAGLSVLRESLEDVYLGLTRSGRVSGHGRRRRHPACWRFRRRDRSAA